MDLLMGTPLSDHFHLQADADNGGGFDGGQVTEETPPVEETPVDTGQAAAEEQSDPFFSYAFEDGEERKFTSPDELKGFIRDGVLRHSDYTKKTQSVAEERKKLEADRQRYDAEYSQMLQMKQEHDKIQQYLSKLPPQAYQALKQQIAQAQQGNQKGDPRVDKLMEEFEADKKARQEREQAETERQQREAAFSELEKQYQDFNRDEVLQLAKALEEAPPGGQMRALMELLYHANRGKKTPAQIERDMAQNFARKKNLKTPISGGGKPPSNPGSAQYNNTDEALQAALSEL